jgi:mutator protein MutT
MSFEQSTRREGVVIACRREDGRWLMVRRSMQVSRAPGAIGFPGGEIEPGETQKQAVIREAKEEIGIDVKPIRCVWEYDWPDTPWMLYAWLAKWVGGDITPEPREIAEVLWMTEREGAEHPDALHTCAPMLAALQKHVASDVAKRGR